MAKCWATLTAFFLVVMGLLSIPYCHGVTLAMVIFKTGNDWHGTTLLQNIVRQNTGFIPHSFAFSPNVAQAARVLRADQLPLDGSVWYASTQKEVNDVVNLFKGWYQEKKSEMQVEIHYFEDDRAYIQPLREASDPRDNLPFLDVAHMMDELYTNETPRKEYIKHNLGEGMLISRVAVEDPLMARLLFANYKRRKPEIVIKTADAVTKELKSTIVERDDDDETTAEELAALYDPTRNVMPRRRQRRRSVVEFVVSDAPHDQVTPAGQLLTLYTRNGRSMAPITSSANFHRKRDKKLKRKKPKKHPRRH